MRKFVKTSLACSSLILVAACGGSGGGGGGQTTAGGTGSLGLIQNATVNFYQADDSTLIGSGDTGTSGTVQVPAGSYDGPVVVEIVGDDDDAQYFDEATDQYQPFPAGDEMHAIVPSTGGVVGVTPLTEVAYQQAVAQGLFPITTGAVQGINEIVRASLAPGLSSILTVPTLVDENTADNSLGEGEPDLYAIYLAGLSVVAQENGGGGALAVLRALSEDAGDGVIDGMNGGMAVNAPYMANYVNVVTAAIDDAAMALGTPEAQVAAGDTAPDNNDVDAGGVENDPTGGTGGTGGSGGGGGGI
ncbi:hypothetical protein RM531_15425 [Salinisphaera sp. P385]|uniref:Lipoprotein n=1 Tax=Spectribacter acetivorans TaxID=3075603 RepID=A0ABU3BCK0_9GAMM|nr:hypothetical protein [Salinisphaera sp. P385]MDT0619863.1 hypothetical protein [Salinisphaera sp. P385]